MENDRRQGALVGQRFEAVHVLRQREFDDFATLSGDRNPIHVDTAYALESAFGGTVAHGMLLYAHLGALLSAAFPGSRQLRHAMTFRTGTHAGEHVVFRAEVVEVLRENGSLRLAVSALRPSGELGLEGETWLALPEAR